MQFVAAIEPADLCKQEALPSSTQKQWLKHICCNPYFFSFSVSRSLDPELGPAAKKCLTNQMKWVFDGERRLLNIRNVDTQ